MKSAILCLAVWLAAVCAAVQALPQPQKRSVDAASKGVDPMCPEGKNGPCRELPLGQQGSIQVRNDGWVTLQFTVEYKLGYQKVLKESKAFTWTLKRTIDIPAEAEDILVTIQGIGAWGVTSDILKRQYKYPVIRCYSSADAQTVNEVGCH